MKKKKKKKSLLARVFSRNCRPKLVENSWNFNYRNFNSEMIVTRGMSIIRKYTWLYIKRRIACDDSRWKVVALRATLRQSHSSIFVRMRGLSSFQLAISLSWASRRVERKKAFEDAQTWAWLNRVESRTLITDVSRYS